MPINPANAPPHMWFLRWMTASRVRRNIVYNYAGSAVMALAPLVAIPFLVDAFGPARWGLVAFATLLVSILSLVNAGLAQAMIREFGRGWAQRENDGGLAVRKLLLGYERLYWGFALLVSLAAAPFAGQIAVRWLNLGGLEASQALLAIYCAIGIFLFQFPGAIYKAVLNALQLHGKLNAIQVTSIVARNLVGALLAIWLQSILVYLIFNILVSLAETSYSAFACWRIVGRENSTRFALRELFPSLRYSLAMSAVVMFSLGCVFLDRLFVSKMLTIEDVGYYAIAASLGYGLLRAVYPLFVAVQPRLVEVADDPALVRGINIKLILLVFAIVVAGALGYLVLGRFFLSIWLHNPAVEVPVGRALDWLLIAIALNAFYHIPYANWVSRGQVEPIARVSIVSFVLAAIVTPVAIQNFGLPGAAVAPIIINLVGIAGGLLWNGFRPSRAGESAANPA